MKPEEDVCHQIIKELTLSPQDCVAVRARRLSVEVAYERFDAVLRYAVENVKFSQLCTITGLDEGENLSFIYHLAHENGMVLNLKTSVAKSNPVIRSITGLFPSAEIYEREIVDLFGAVVTGLGPGNRYPLTDDWPADDHPLRKDWKPRFAPSEQETKS